MDYMSNMKEISVGVVTYNSDWEKTRKTLESILVQKFVNFEIVISDDGSKKTNYDKIKDFFAERRFEDYVLVHNNENVGTIKNCIRAGEHSNGKYIKMISPGDLLFGEDSLWLLLSALKKAKKKWSFGSMICVSDSTKTEMETLAFHLGPQDIKPYEDNNDELIKYNYIYCADKISVTTILVEKETWKRYLGKITNYIKYAEDYSYELMIWDGIMPVYVPAYVEIYEVGSGISTSNNDRWLEILSNEKKVFYEKILKISRKKEEVEKIYLPEYRELWTGVSLDSIHLTQKDYEKCCLGKLNEIVDKSRGKDVWIYGAGIAGQIMLECLTKNGIEPRGFVDINHQKIHNINGYCVVGLEDVENRQDAFFVISLMRYRNVVVSYLKENNIKEDAYLYVYAKGIIRH